MRNAGVGRPAVVARPQGERHRQLRLPHPLDMRKYANKFDEIQELLGLSDKERNQVLSINRANDPMRRYKEVWIGLGGVHSAVYATETSLEEYLCYTTEETEKLELQRLTEKLGGNIELAIRQLAERKRNEDH